MTRPLLYSYRRCPYAMRARMALLTAGIAFDVYDIHLRDKPADLLRASPKGTVPVLVLPEGEVMEQSWDIMRWALDRAPTATAWWLPTHTAAHQDLLARNDGPFKQALDQYKYPERHPDIRPETARQHALHALLLPLERALGGGDFLAGTQACATDLAIFPFVRQCAAVDPAWFSQQALPRTQRWLAHWLASAVFAAAMHKLPAQTRLPFPAAQ